MTHFFNDANERTRFFKFATVGAIGTVVDFGMFNLLNIVFGIPPVYAQAVSFCVAVANNFLWNRHWTYPESRSKAVHHQVLQFALVNVGGLLIRTPIVGGLEHPLGVFLTRFGIQPATADGLGENLALATSIGIVMIWNYFANRYWTYNDI